MSWYDEWPSWLKTLVTGASLGIISDQPFDEHQTQKDPSKYANIGPDIPKKASGILADQNKGPTPGSTSPTPSPSGSQGKTLAEAGNTALSANNAAQRRIDELRRNNPLNLIGNGMIGGVNPNAPVYEGIKKRGSRQQGDPTEFPRKQNTFEGQRPISEVALDPYDWSDEKVKQVAKMMVNAGFDKAASGDRGVIAGIWANYAATSALMLFKGHKVSPMSLLKNQSYGLGAGIGGPKTVTSTDSSIRHVTATSARQLAQEALSNRLGRDATDGEVSEFVKELRAEEARNPTVTKTTTTTNAKGTSQTSSSTTQEGMSGSAVTDFAKQYMLGYDSEEAKAYQAAGIMMPWFFQALGGPV